MGEKKKSSIFASKKIEEGAREAGNGGSNQSSDSAGRIGEFLDVQRRGDKALPSHQGEKEPRDGVRERGSKVSSGKSLRGKTKGKIQSLERSRGS